MLGAEMTRQCAWCFLVVDSTGQYRIQAGRKIRTATHGICGACKLVMLEEIDTSRPVAMAA